MVGKRARRKMAASQHLDTRAHFTRALALNWPKSRVYWRRFLLVYHAFFSSPETPPGIPVWRVHFA